MSRGDFELDIIAYLQRTAGEHKASIEVFLANGGAQTPEAYWQSVGKYSAWNAVLDELATIEKQYIAQ
jgi:hypothetical protein